MKHPRRLFPFSPISTCRLFLSEFHDDVMWQYNVMRNQNLSWSIFALIVCRFVLRPGSRSPTFCFLLLRNAEAYTFILSFYSLWIHLEWAFYGSQHSFVCLTHKKWIRRNAQKRRRQKELFASSFDIRFTCWSKRRWKIIQGNGFADHLLSFEGPHAECAVMFEQMRVQFQLAYGCEDESHYKRDLSNFYCRQELSMLNLSNENWLSFHPIKSVRSRLQKSSFSAPVNV